MSRMLFHLIVGLFTSAAFAGDGKDLFKSPSFFKSVYGFELMYPACWEAVNQEEEFKGPLEKSKSIVLQETAKCARPRLSADLPNGLTVQTWREFKTAEEATQKLNAIEKRLKGAMAVAEVLEKKTLGFRRYKLGGADALLYAEALPSGEILYSYVLHCGLRAVNITGPAAKMPAAEVLGQIKAGTILAPEPERTITESFKCKR